MNPQQTQQQSQQFPVQLALFPQAEPAVLPSIPVTPSTVSTKGSSLRRRFQRGRIIQRGKTPVWVGIFREDQLKSDGTIRRIQRSVNLGRVKEVSMRAAWKALQPYLDSVNTVRIAPKRGITLETFVKEWRANVSTNLKGSTVRAMESHLRAHILPKLGKLTLTEIDTKEIQSFVTYLAKGGRTRKTVQNVLLSLSSILRKARAWDYACGKFSLADITMPRQGVRKEQRAFTDAEIGRIIAAAQAPFSTILAVTSILGLRIGETLALRVSDLDFTNKIVRVRQSVDAATRTIAAVKSESSSADLPMPVELETRLRKHLQSHSGHELLFVNRRGRAFSANKLRGKHLHPLLAKLGIPKGGFHSMRHGTASSLLANGETPAVVQRHLRHSDARITLGIYGHVVGDALRDSVELRSARIAQNMVN